MAREESTARTLPVEGLVIRHVRRRVRALLAAFAVSMVMIPCAPILLVLSGGGIHDGLQGFLVALVATIAAAMALAMAGRKPSRRHWKPGRITVDEQGFDVEIGRALRRFPKHALQGGWVERDSGHARETTAVLLFKGDVRVHMAPASGKSASRLLSLSGVEASERAFVLHVPAASPRARGATALGLVLSALIGLPILLTAALILYLAAAGEHHDAQTLIVTSLLAVGACAATGWLASRLRITTLTVGTDGVLIGRLRRRFIPFDRLDSIDAIDRDVVLQFTDGSRTSFRTSSPDHALDVEGQVRNALRVRGGRRREHRAALLTTLHRGERTVHDWLDTLRTMVSDATYRTTSVEPEELVRIVEDASASKRVRAAAAFALARHPQPEVQRRMRIAALGCADDETRKVLEQAAVGEESVLSSLES